MHSRIINEPLKPNKTGVEAVLNDRFILEQGKERACFLIVKQFYKIIFKRCDEFKK